MPLPLDQLNDILAGPLPAVDSTWIVGGFAILILTLTVLRRFTRWLPRHQRYRRAIRELKSISQSEQPFVPEINLFLKKYASLFWERDVIAKLHHTEWLHFLDEHGHTNLSQFNDDWQKWSYGIEQPDHKQQKIIFRGCKRWISAVNRRELL